jgi:hypothetical protein
MNIKFCFKNSLCTVSVLTLRISAEKQIILFFLKILYCLLFSTHIIGEGNKRHCFSWRKWNLLESWNQAYKRKCCMPLTFLSPTSGGRRRSYKKCQDISNCFLKLTDTTHDHTYNCIICYRPKFFYVKESKRQTIRITFYVLLKGWFQTK